MISGMRTVVRVLLAAAAIAYQGAPLRATAAPDPAFTRFIESLWPEAAQMGVSRKTFTSSIHGLEPDLTLPDLEIPGRGSQPQRARFSQRLRQPAQIDKRR